MPDVVRAQVQQQRNVAYRILTRNSKIPYLAADFAAKYFILCKSCEYVHLQRIARFPCPNRDDAQ